MSRAAMRIAMVTALAASVLVGCTDGPPRVGVQRAALVEGPGQSSDAEAVFAEAYRLEQRASFGQAVQYYNLVVDRFPASPLADIARTRVAGLAGQAPMAPTDASV